MKTTCCRSAPRCAGCPVLLAARARRRHDDSTAALIESVLAAGPRPLPECVATALAELEAARRPAERESVAA